jgi:hypothetical protein
MPDGDLNRPAWERVPFRGVQVLANDMPGRLREPARAVLPARPAAVACDPRVDRS